jgi:hypothetical protein
VEGSSSSTVLIVAALAAVAVAGVVARVVGRGRGRTVEA